MFKGMLTASQKPPEIHIYVCTNWL